jgi:hypothetical protein
MSSREEQNMPDLFDKVKQGIEKGINTVNLKSKEVVSSLKINMDIEALQRQIIDAYRVLGEAVYSMTTQQNLNEERIREQCAEISLLKEQLSEKERELEQVRFETGTALGKTYCSGCQAELADNTRYCPHCGAKVN